MGFWDLFRSKWARKVISAQVQIVELVNVIVTAAPGGITDEEWGKIKRKAEALAAKLGLKW